MVRDLDTLHTYAHTHTHTRGTYVVITVFGEYLARNDSKLYNLRISTIVAAS